MKIIQLILTIAILIVLISIRIALEDLKHPVQVAEVNHIYKYNVESYGMISLNDKIVGLTVKED